MGVSPGVDVKTGVSPVGTGVGVVWPGGIGVGGGVPAVGVGGNGMTEGIGVGVAAPETAVAVGVGGLGLVIVLESLQAPAANARRTADPKSPSPGIRFNFASPRSVPETSEVP